MFCLLAILLACRLADISLAQGNIDSDVVARSRGLCSNWHKTHSFEDLRACYLSVVNRGVSKATVVAMLGSGERVSVANDIWKSPREAYSYKPVDRSDFHYIAVYENNVAVEQCSSSLRPDSAGAVTVVLP